MAINALKFYYAQILRRRFFFDIKHAKYYCVAALLYGAGLRVGEVIRIRMQDIDFVGRGLLKVHQGKGKKDRYTLLPKQIIPHLEAQQRLKSLDAFLFSGAGGKGHLTTMSAEFKCN